MRYEYSSQLFRRKAETGKARFDASHGYARVDEQASGIR